MEKPADANHPILDVIKRRWSPRAFSNRPIEDQKLRTILEAFRWSESSYNEQPWALILAKRVDEEAFAKALTCLVEANQAWAKDAPLLILTAARENFARNGKPNRVAEHDLGLAMSKLALQATAMGLFAHQMGGVDPEKVRETYGIPEGWHAMTACAVGYAGDIGQLSEKLRELEQAERTRMPLHEFIFADQWGQAAKIVEGH